MSNLHQHTDHCVYDTQHKLITTFCNECSYKGCKWEQKDSNWKYKCASYKVLQLLDIED